MNTPYIKPGELGSFDDIEVIKNPVKMTSVKMCHICSGHGCWNLKLNAYGQGRHFQSICDHCQGYGWIDSNINCQRHNFVLKKNLGRCFNRYECSECGIIRDIDSGD